jgi:hypothetical protein
LDRSPRFAFEAVRQSDVQRSSFPLLLVSATAQQQQRPYQQYGPGWRIFQEFVESKSQRRPKPKSELPQEDFGLKRLSMSDTVCLDTMYFQ